MRINSLNFKDLRSRLWVLMLALVAFRFGAHVPLPGLDPAHLQQMMARNASSPLMGMLNLLSGGSFSQVTVLALGLIPFISASLVVQIASFFVPALEKLKKEGTAGQKVMNRYTRMGAVMLAALQAWSLALVLESTPGLVLSPGLGFKVMTVLTLTTGTMVMLWLSDQITERGLGNGVSILICTGIAASIPGSAAALAQLAALGGSSLVTALLATAAVLATTVLVVFVEKSLRKIPVTYAKSSAPKGRTGQGSHFPLKLNMAGVMAPVLASTVMMAPQALWEQLKNVQSGPTWLREAVRWLLADSATVHAVLYAVVLVAFSFLYASLSFNVKETSEQLRRSNAFIPGLRPGEQTADYLRTVLRNLTLAGSAYMALVCVLPGWFAQRFSLPFAFGGTSLLIVVVVTMEMMAQVSKYRFADKYAGMLKKAPARA